MRRAPPRGPCQCVWLAALLTPPLSRRYVSDSLARLCYLAGNFAQNIELWDRLFGTYKDYSEIVDKHQAKKVKAN